MSKSRLCKLSHGAGDARFSYTWDAENRLTQVESLSSSPTASKRKVVWQYDGQGRRVRQTTYNGGSGSYLVTNDFKFVADGWRHVAELNATNNVLIRSYLWGVDLSGSLAGAGGVGGLVALNSKANGVHFAGYDGNGNIVALADGRNGTASGRYENGPFAEPIRSSGSMASENSFRLSTKRTDDTADLTLYEYRLLRPTTGRWLSRDPAGENAGFNLHSFVSNEPLSRVDYLGLLCCNGKWYNPFKHCCCNKKLLRNREVKTGIKRCSAPIEGEGKINHTWLEIDGTSAGFHPADPDNLFGGPGKVLNPESSTYVDSQQKTCTEIQLNPCKYNIPAVKKCINDLIAMNKADPPKYFLGIFACYEWANTLINNCEFFNQGCAPFP